MDVFVTYISKGLNESRIHESSFYLNNLVKQLIVLPKRFLGQSPKRLTKKTLTKMFPTKTATLHGVFLLVARVGLHSFQCNEINNCEATKPT